MTARQYQLPRRNRFLRRLLVLLMCGSVTGAARIVGAQTIEAQPNRGGALDISAGKVTFDGFSTAHVTSLFSTLWSNSDRLSVTATGGASRFETGHATAYGEVHLLAPISHASTGAQLSLEADGGGGAYRGERSVIYGRAGFRLTHANNTDANNTAERLWLAAGVGAAGKANSYATAHASVGAATAQRHCLTSSATLDLAHARSTYVDATASATWLPCTGGPLARVSADLSAGVRAGGNNDSRQQWSQIGAAVRLSRFSALTASYGTAPSDPQRALIGLRFTSVGFRLSFGGRSRDAAPMRLLREAELFGSRISLSGINADGTRTLALNMSGVTVLEVMGDFDGWRALTMTREATHAGSDTWIISFPIEPGTHRINIRVNGGDWQPVPGLPEIADDFGGRASVLVVP